MNNIIHNCMKTNIFRSMFISAACLVLLAFAACSRDDNPKTPEALISINPSSLILESTDVSATFTLTCNQAWNISTTETWITQISPSSGTEGASNVVITIETEVNENDLRSGKLVIECGSKKTGHDRQPSRIEWSSCAGTSLPDESHALRGRNGLQLALRPKF